jgi:ATP-binding cassette subfamily B protein
MEQKNNITREKWPIWRWGWQIQMVVSKPKDFRKSLGKLFWILKPYKFIIFITIILATASTIFSVFNPKLLWNMTNQMVLDLASIKIYKSVQENLGDNILPNWTTLSNLPKNISFDKSYFSSLSETQQKSLENLDLLQTPIFHYEILWKIALILIILYLLSAVAGSISTWIFVNIIQKIVYKLRQDLSKKINRLPISYFDKNQFGDVLSRITNDVDTMAQSLNQVVSQTISSIITLIWFIIMMLLISWQLTIIAFVVLPISLFFVKIIMKNSQKYFKNQQDSLWNLNWHIEENYAGQMIVKAFSGEQKATKTFSKINDKLYESSWKSQFFSGLMMPFMHFISNLGYVASVIMWAWLVLNGKLSIWWVQAFIQYMGNLNQPIVQIGQIANLLQSAVASTERIFEFLEETEETYQNTSNKFENNEKNSESGWNGFKNSKFTSKIKWEVEFKNVKFSYEKWKPVIKNFSTHIKPGQKIAIVWPTWAGKTTIVNLLMRFYDPDSWSIKIDWIDTKNMERTEVRACFGMVLQDTWLFNWTITENLKYGNNKASLKQIQKVTESAYLDHFVNSLPNGYDTEIWEDSENISEWEKQLLTIARAMLEGAPMLILDEATSSVDTRTEVLIQKAMENLTKWRTSFVIAHRLSTIKNADLILVMKNGDIIEQWNHKQLIAKNGFYAELYNSQFAE